MAIDVRGYFVLGSADSTTVYQTSGLRYPALVSTLNSRRIETDCKNVGFLARIFQSIIHGLGDRVISI
jgi:hypothetical protein